MKKVKFKKKVRLQSMFGCKSECLFIWLVIKRPISGHFDKSKQHVLPV